MAKYRFRFFYEYGGCCLWSDDRITENKFGYSVNHERDLSLSQETIKLINSMSNWFDQSFNKDYPPDPSPWRQDECDRFNYETEKLLDLLHQELGSDFEILNEFTKLTEDPDLDQYLKDPKNFNRYDK